MAFSCDGRQEGNYPNPDDCSTFFTCVTGHPTPYLQACSTEGFHFSVDTGRCEHPAEARCAY
ncbi:carbohydrate-binding module family 14 protein [Sphaerisporangium perillae]|uniref:carbohydrate-binding module family 14 protein n=1 Tax=Sphaerisporangium perillae TaxID=2935860 RepID=UPI0035578AF9